MNFSGQKFVNNNSNVQNNIQPNILPQNKSNFNNQNVHHNNDQGLGQFNNVFNNHVEATNSEPNPLNIPNVQNIQLQDTPRDPVSSNVSV